MHCIDDKTCRCGWDGTGDHLCHRCAKEPGQRRLYLPSYKFSLAGVQEKFSMSETWGCDSCWSSFQKLLGDQVVDVDQRLLLAAELRAAGLFEKANALLSEIVREQTGLRPIGELNADLDAKLADLRSALGMRPRRQKSRNPRPAVQDRLIVLLADSGVSECFAWSTSKGYWLRDQADVMRWECRARCWNDLERRGVGFHVGSWSSMSDCVRYGITVADGEKQGDCTISVEPKYPQKRKL